MARIYLSVLRRSLKMLSHHYTVLFISEIISRFLVDHSRAWSCCYKKSISPVDEDAVYLYNEKKDSNKAA